MSNFGENLRKARVLKKVDQKTLADNIGVTQAAISQFENGERIPAPNKIKDICKFLEISEKELTGDVEAEIGQAQLFRKVKGLNPQNIETLIKQAEFLKHQQEKND